MKIEVAFTAFHRTDYFTEVLDSWSKVRGFGSLPKRGRLEPSHNTDKMLNLAKSYDVQLRANCMRQGVLHNPWVALDAAFGEFEADFVILAEDDLVVSDDVLEYFTWASTAYSPEEALGVCANTSGSGVDSGRTFMAPNFSVWVWGTWKESWFSYIRDTWDHDYSTYNGTPGNESGWDWNLTRMAQSVKPFVHVEISRSKHIGKDDGTHMTAALFDTIQCPSFQLHREPAEFYRAV